MSFSTQKPRKNTKNMRHPHKRVRMPLFFQGMPEIGWEVGEHWDWLSSPESNPLFHSRLDSYLTNLRAIR